MYLCQAVQLDTADGLSWSILGNAYFAHFFNVSQNPRTLKQSMSAYRQAEKDPVARSDPDLNFNKGNKAYDIHSILGILDPVHFLSSYRMVLKYGMYRVWH